ncbi:MAG TPA: hypothetical protein VLH61_03130, partial [Bacteroidales bacterium]|nr:hypothetical protein [Bacteroidales bacterium]
MAIFVLWPVARLHSNILMNLIPGRFMIYLSSIKVFIFGTFRITLIGLLLFIQTVEGYSHQQERRIPAFPGAEGGGRYTSGGRGGQVIKVTNLNDSGPGSLRHALEASGPRTVVFEVSGTIELQSRIRIRHGNLTVAGQTAPGQGITIKGHPVQLAANNVIIRFIRFRPGDLAGIVLDALTGFNRRDIIIDHCSFSWATDEVASFYDNEYFTLQWSIISESLNNSVHYKGAHGYGGIWGGRNASFLNNIIAHHNSRNPRLNGTRENPPGGIETTELINNLIYNWGDKAIYGGEGGRYIVAGNIFIPGPATRQANRDEILEAYAPVGQFYLRDNVIANPNNRFIRAGWQNVTLPEEANEGVRMKEPFVPNNLHNAQRPRIQYEVLLLRAGASLRRDATDERIIEEIKGRTYTFGNKGIIDSQEQVGGWPQITGGTAPIDKDNDGVCDQWEINNGLNPDNPDDGNTFTLNPD